MSKIELVRQLVTGERQFPPSGMTLGLRMVGVRESATTIEMRIRDEFLNNSGGVQGGFLSALADAAMGTSLATVCDLEESHATLEFKVSFLSPATVEKSPLTASGLVLYRGRRFAHTKGEIRSATGELVATATASWIIRRDRPDAD